MFSLIDGVLDKLRVSARMTGTLFTASPLAVSC
jgi:hypothetical protein